MDANQYTYRIVFLAKEQTFFAMCDQFVHITAKAPSYQEALDKVRKNVSINLGKAA